MRKPVWQLLRSTGTLRSVLKSSRKRLGRRLGQRPAALTAIAQQGKTPPTHGFSYGPVFDHLDAELAAIERDLATTEGAYDTAQVHLGQVRRSRNQAAAGLRDLHAPLQRLLAAHPHLGGSAIVAETPESPPALVLQAGMAVDFLRDFERNPPAPVGGITLDAGGLADNLEPQLKLLNGLITAVAGADSEVIHARAQADEAFARADQVVSWVSRNLASLSGLAGGEALRGHMQRDCG